MYKFQKKLHADDREKNKNKNRPHTPQNTLYSYSILSKSWASWIQKRVTEMRTVGDKKRWKKRDTANESENQIATNLSLCFYFCCHFFLLSFLHCRWTCTMSMNVYQLRSAFRELFRIFRLCCTHYIHFRSKNRTIIVIFSFLLHQVLPHFSEPHNSILWRCTYCLSHLSPCFRLSQFERFPSCNSVKFVDKRNGSTPHVRDSIKTTLSRFRYISLSTRFLMRLFLCIGKSDR